MAKPHLQEQTPDYLNTSILGQTQSVNKGWEPVSKTADSFQSLSNFEIRL